MAFLALCCLVVLAELEGHVMMFTCDMYLVQPHEQDWPSTLFQLLKPQFSKIPLSRSCKVAPLPYIPTGTGAPKVGAPIYPLHEANQPAEEQKVWGNWLGRPRTTLMVDSS